MSEKLILITLNFGVRTIALLSRFVVEFWLKKRSSRGIRHKACLLPAMPSDRIWPLASRLLCFEV